ncbi:putative helicase MAGATAMA 3 [Chlorella sorokiniana]|uniref:Helicase MAGATAMA 3 n=1 Tax=Chlorella sorokiniana TaxID=3076 RepID=A0A2P6TLG2_CHLSO|nr:putative helicase MAGATAMA 3 [Chlorella sorokiniana]|eukprot:PRW45131.1 putative helicase MAGATAMA 3 [Chlorella sorokiniana]
MESQYAQQLQDVLLSWDYWELEQRMAEGGGPIAELPTIPKQFASVEEYVRVFEPLLLEECAAQMLRGQEEGQVLTSQPAVVAAAQTRPEDESLLVRLTLPPGVSSTFHENDMMLISRDNPEDEHGEEQYHALGAVEGHEGEASLRVRFKLTDAAQAGNARGLQRAKSMRHSLAKPASQWWVLKLSSMSTIMREWAAIHCIAHMPLREVLLTAKPSQSLLAARGKLEVPPSMRAQMEKTYNESQMAAVTGGLDGSPVVLIQGPPGTGKTKTILGLLSIIMHSAPRGAFASAAPNGSSSSAPTSPTAAAGLPSYVRYQKLSADKRRRVWMEANPYLLGRPDPREEVVPPEQADSSDAFGLLRRCIPRRIGKSEGPKARVLVCAPSNSALDEIVLRLITVGLTDQDGRVFTPNVVRVGVSIHHSVQSVALDTLVEHRLGGDGSKNVARWEKDRLRMSILEEANIVCTTLSFSGSSAFTRLARKFDVVVIDEAAQAVEPSTLVPLAHGGAKQVYLVGDPVQLPATVMSQRALGQGYSESLFKRLQTAGYPVHMLDTQYRMHPDIREFPSLNFYGGNLKDGPSVAQDTKRPWHASRAFQPLVFIDVKGTETVPEGSSSLVNEREAEMVLQVYRELRHRHPELGTKPSVAVISPYKAQVSLLRRLFKAALGDEAAKLVDINTIDGFQGREKDVAFFSTVRSQRGNKGIGFVADERRINVGLTRARATLIVVGHVESLQTNPRWSALVSHARKQHCMFKAGKPFSDWVTQLADGEVEPVPPTAEDTQEWEPQAEMHVHDAYDFSDDEGVPPFREDTAQAAGFRLSLAGSWVMELAGHWNNPPPWLLELVTKRLHGQDRVACLAVCKGWQALESELFSVVDTPSTQEAAQALEAALDAVLQRHAAGLQLLELIGGSTRVHGPVEESLGRIAALLQRHAPQLRQLGKLQVEQDFAGEALAPALGSLQAVTRLTFLPPFDNPWPLDLDGVEGLRFPQALRSAHINWLERFPKALAQCSERVDLELQFRFPEPVGKHLHHLQDLLIANGMPIEQADAITEEQLMQKLGLLEPRDLPPLAQLTQLTSLCISGDFQRCPPSLSALGRLQDLHFDTTRRQLSAVAASLSDALAALPGLRDLNVFMCRGFKLQPGPWQRQLVKLEAAWLQLAPDADVAARACEHLIALEELKLSGWGQKRTVPSGPALALLASIGVECRALRKLRYSGNSVRWVGGEQRPALEALLAALPRLQLLDSYRSPLNLASLDRASMEHDGEEEDADSESEEEEESENEDEDGEEAEGPPGCAVM